VNASPIAEHGSAIAVLAARLLAARRESEIT